MKRFKVKLTIRKMGMQCKSCKQDFETEVEATSQEEAIDIAKFLSKANLDTHKINISLIKEITS